MNLPISYPVEHAIGKEHINHLPVLEYRGGIELVTELEQCQQAVRQLERCSVLGFDTETRPSFRKGQSYLPSLIQLAGDETVYLFQISRFPLCHELLSLLGNAKVIKAGAGLSFDIKQLQQITAFEARGFADIGPLASRLGIRQTGLRTLCALLFGKRLSKSARCSNWGRTHLSPEQLKYAATDAWISREIYLALRQLTEESRFQQSVNA